MKTSNQTYLFSQTSAWCLTATDSRRPAPRLSWPSIAPERHHFAVVAVAAVGLSDAGSADVFGVIAIVIWQRTGNLGLLVRNLLALVLGAFWEFWMEWVVGLAPRLPSLCHRVM